MFSGLRGDEYRIVVTVGGERQVDLLERCPWTADYPLEWRWVPAADFSRWSYWATALQRYRYRFTAETVVMLDGDVLVTGRLDEPIDAVRGTRKFAAVPAYYSPFFLHPEHLEEASPVEWWQKICDLAGVRLPPCAMEHTGWSWMREQNPRHVEQLQYSPPYPNAGAVITSAETARQIGENFLADLDLVNSVSRTLLSGQIALTLAISRLGLDWTPLPLRYNFQNIPPIYDANPGEAADIRVLHFLQTAEIDRVRDFKDYRQVEQLVIRPGLHAVNRFLVGRLEEVHRQITNRRQRARGVFAG
jgi:hypothetical protein